MAIQNLHLGANLLDDLSSLHLGKKKKPYQPGPDFPKAHHSVTYYPLREVSRSLLFTLFPPAEIQSFYSLLGLRPADAEEQREKVKHC